MLCNLLQASGKHDSARGDCNAVGHKLITGVAAVSLSIRRLTGGHRVGIAIIRGCASRFVVRALVAWTVQGHDHGRSSSVGFLHLSKLMQPATVSLLSDAGWRDQRCGRGPSPVPIRSHTAHGASRILG